MLVDIPKAPPDPALLQASLTDTKLRNDPRIKSLLDNQFNAVSSLIQRTSSGADALVAATSKDKSASDSRFGIGTGAGARDPRLQRQQSQPVTEPMPPTAALQTNPMVSGMSNNPDVQMQEMIKMQLQLMQQQQGAVQAPTSGMPPNSMMAMGVGVGGPMMPPMPPMPMDVGMPLMVGNGPGTCAAPMPGPPVPPMYSSAGPMPPPIGMPMAMGPPPPAPGAWMPQFGNGLPNIDMAGPAPPPATMLPHPNTAISGSAPGTNGPAVMLSTGLNDSDICAGLGVSGESGPGSGGARLRSSRWNRGSPYSSPAQTDNSAVSVPVSGANSEKPLSLREKRKDLQYESPLASGQSRPASSSDPRYNEIPNVKVRKLKTSPSSSD